jgi:tetratricopeptide (TPR) repeat protein
MSIINQMLKDLDDRRGPAFGAQIAALQGMGLVNANQIQWQNSLPLIGRGLAAVLVVIIGYHSITWWLASKPGKGLSDRTPHTTHASAPETSALKINPPLSSPLNPGTDAEQIPEPGKANVLQPSTAAVNTSKLLNLQPSPARKVAPVKILTPEQKAERLFASAQQAFADHRQQRGEQLLLDTLDAFPRHSDARTQLAALLVNRQQPDDAELLLADGLASNPRNLELAVPYAQLLAERDAPGPALDTLDRAIEQNHTNADALALRAALLYRLERHAESAAAYRMALDAQPQRALWWTGLAVALEHDRQPGQALHAYRRATALPLEQAVADYVEQRIRLLNRKPTQD